MKRGLKCLIILLNAITLSLYSQTEHYRFNHLTLKEGLPHTLIFSIHQTSNGFIWLGTNNGLARYDGYNFKLYQPNPNNSNSIAHKAVLRIIEDNEGKLWLNLQTNIIDVFDPKTEKFTHYNSETNDPASPFRNANYKSYKDETGDIWICSNNGVLKFDFEKKAFKKYGYDKLNEFSLPNPKVYDVVADKKGLIWAATEKGIGIIDPAGNKIVRFYHFLGAMSAIDTIAVSCFQPDKQGNIWIGSYENGIFKYEYNTKKLTKICCNNKNAGSNYVSQIYSARNGDIFALSRGQENILHVISNTASSAPKISKYLLSKNYSAEYFNAVEDQLGNFWIASSAGLFQYKKRDNNIIQFKNNPFNEFSISSNQVRYIYKDRTDILWISVYKTGLDKIDLYQKKFIWLTRDPMKANNTLPENNIISILKDKKGCIWMGTLNNGVVKYDPKNDSYKTFEVDSKNPQKLSTGASSALFEDAQGNIWVGSYYGQIDVINPYTNRITRINETNGPYGSLSASLIRRIVQDNDGNIWLATSTKGLVYYQPKTRKFHYPSVAYDKNYLEHGFYRTCYPDSKGRILVGTQSGGLLIFDKNKKEFTKLKHDPKNSNSLSSNTIYDILEDTNGNYWIGTSAGLNYWDIQKNTIQRLNTTNELCNNTVYSVIPDENGSLWLSTDNGLSKYNIKKNKFTNFYENDGILCSEFNSNAFLKANDGIIFLGTPKGLMFFNPSFITTNPHKPKVQITFLKILNNIINPGDTYNKRVILKNDISFTDTLLLTHKEYTFTLEFASLHFTTPEKNSYRYILEGFDNDWIMTDAKHRYATYSNLSPGTYTFRLRATNNDGMFCTEEDEARLTIIIKPPFWKTWLFRIFIIILIISLGIFLYSRRIKHLKKRQILLEQMVSERTKAIEETNAMLEEQKEEILIQKETLQEVNTLLKQQQQIIAQNKEIEQHRNNLEKTVEERTQELVEAKKKAEESDRLKSAFLANMSHEIRTPMNAIVGFSGLLEDNAFNNEQKNEFINLIRKNSESLLVLIDDILDMSKIQAHQLVIFRKSVDVNELINEVYSTYIHVAQHKKIQFKLNKPFNTAYYIETDRVRLKQILANLINNAIKFTEAGSIELGLNLTEDGAFIQFYVKDTGIGISQEWGDSIFERFLKVEHDKNHLYGGSGLGLAISKSLIELMGGKIWYESELKRGTVFYFTLPNTTQQTTIIQNPNRRVNPLGIDLKEKYILIAEDEDTNYKLIWAYLSKTGATLIRATNGLEAIEAIEKNPAIVLAIVDIKMPVMDGATATLEIKNRWPNIPVIAQTAYALNEEREKYLNYGFDAYLVKPLNEKQLYEAIRHVFRFKA